MLLKVKLTVVAFVEVYKIGALGMPRNAVLPTAEPDHEGAALAMTPPPLGDDPLSVKEKIDPSDSVIAKGCPPPKTVALLYVLISIQQKVCQSGGALPAEVAAPQVAAWAVLAKAMTANVTKAAAKFNSFLTPKRK